MGDDAVLGRSCMARSQILYWVKQKPKIPVTDWNNLNFIFSHMAYVNMYRSHQYNIPLCDARAPTFAPAST